MCNSSAYTTISIIIIIIIINVTLQLGILFSSIRHESFYRNANLMLMVKCTLQIQRVKRPVVTASAATTPAKPGTSGAQGSPQNKLNVPDPFTRRTTKLPRKRQPTQSSARYQVQKVPPDYQHLTPLKGELLLVLLLII